MMKAKPTVRVGTTMTRRLRSRNGRTGAGTSIALLRLAAGGGNSMEALKRGCQSETL
jgi:hypothetical protein